MVVAVTSVLASGALGVVARRREAPALPALVLPALALVGEESAVAIKALHSRRPHPNLL